MTVYTSATYHEAAVSGVGLRHGKPTSGIGPTMGCEFLAVEATVTGPHAGHTREYCIATLEACLIDDPLGYINCTRRMWLMLNEVSPEQEPLKPSRKRKTNPAAQARLL